MMTLTLSDTTFQAGQVTQITVTITGGEGTHAYFGSNESTVRVSLDGSVWSEDVRLYVGETTVFVRVASSVSSGVMQDGLGWFMTDNVETVTDSVDITITGGTPTHYESFGFQLAPRASTVQYNATVVNKSLALGGRVTGTLLDHHYQYEVETVTHQGARSIVQGAAMSTATTQKLIVYDVEYDWDWAWLGWRRPSFRDHVSAISRALGIPIVYHGSDWYPKTDMNILLKKGFSTTIIERLSGSLSEILSRLCGWTNDVPSMVINLYVENGTIYLVQRGYETNTLTPSAWEVMPTLSHSIRHTQWADSQYQTLIPKQISSSDSANTNTPYSGVIQWGTCSLTYEDGYLVQEVNGNVTTVYTYTNDGDGKRLTQKVATEVDPDTQDTVRTTTTTYTYQQTGTQTYLFEEAHVVEEDGVTVESKTTQHVPIGGGWYGTSVIDNLTGETVSSSLSQGAPGNKTSQYMTDAMNDGLKPSSGSGSQRQMVVPLQGVPKARASYPVSDYDTLSAIAGALDSYEGREMVTLSGTVVGGSHIYTYDDKIVYNGQTYYLVSNNVTQTPAKIRQSITAVRFI